MTLLFIFDNDLDKVCYVLEMTILVNFITKSTKFENRKIYQNKSIFDDFINDFDDFVTKSNKMPLKIMFLNEISISRNAHVSKFCDQVVKFV